MSSQFLVSHKTYIYIFYLNVEFLMVKQFKRRQQLTDINVKITFIELCLNHIFVYLNSCISAFICKRRIWWGPAITDIWRSCLCCGVDGSKAPRNSKSQITGYNRRCRTLWQTVITFCIFVTFLVHSVSFSIQKDS